MDRHEVITRTNAVLDRFAGRVPDDVMRGLREMAEVGEQGEAVDELVATLAVHRAPVTAEDRAQLVALVEGMKLRLSRPLDELVGT